VLGVGIYLSLIRHVMRGPMLAQILSTFGLALLLRYTAFWIFSAFRRSGDTLLFPPLSRAGGSSPRMNDFGFVTITET